MADRAEIARRMFADPVEPPMGRRQERYRCPVEGCEATITRKIAMCRPCSKLLPRGHVAAARRHWKDIKEAGWPYQATKAYQERLIDDIILAGERRNG